MLLVTPAQLADSAIVRTASCVDSVDVANCPIPNPLTLEGDANRDGVVSAGDYASVQSHFGETGANGILGDASCDGVVSAGDYASVQANFGNVAPPITAVPEPVTVSLLLIGGLFAIRRRKQGGYLVI